MKILDHINEKWFYVFADLFNKASLYFLTLVFSYIVLPESYGKLSLFNSLVTLFFVVVSCNLTSSYITKKRLETNGSFKKCLSTIVTFMLLMNVLFLGIAFIIFSFQINIYSVSSTILFCSIITAILTCNYELLQTMLVTEKNKKRYLFTSILFSILLIVFSFLLLFMARNMDIYAIIIAKIVLLFGFSIYSLHFLKKKYDITLSINKVILKEALIFSFPLILHSLSGFVLNYLDKFMLNDMESLASTAVYSFSYNLASVMMVVSIAINKAFIPHFFQMKNEKAHDDIEKLISRDLKWICLLYVVYTATIGYIYNIFPSTYYQSIYIFILLTFNYLVFYGYNIYSNYLYYQGKTARIFTNTLISGILNVILNIILIPRYSSMGATISTVISYFVLFFLYYISVKKKEKYCYPMIKFLKGFVSVGVLSIIYCIGYRYFIFRLIWLLMVLGFTVYSMKEANMLKRMKL